MITKPPSPPTSTDGTLVSVMTFARHHGVTRQAVYKWEERGWLVKSGGKVLLEQSDALIARFRDVSDARSARKPPAAPAAPPPPPRVEPPALIAATSPARASEVPPVPPPRRLVEALDNSDAADALATGSAPTEEARRVKENYLALKGKLEYELSAGGLIDMDIAKQVLFDEFRAVRNHWMGWPSRYAAQIAADLNIEADRVTDVLTQYIHRHISEISEPDGQFRRG